MITLLLIAILLALIAPQVLAFIIMACIVATLLVGGTAVSVFLLALVGA